jgi:hypothetical protein
MAKKYYILITGGTSQGPYTVYYDSINVSNIATLFSNNNPATNLSYSDLTTNPGVLVSMPDSITRIILYNNGCNSNITYTLPTPLYGTVELSPQNGLNTGTYAVFVNGVFDGTFKSGSRTYIQGTTIRVDYQNPTCNVTLNGSNYSSATDITINGNTTNTFVLNNADYWFDLGTGYCDINLGTGTCTSYKNQQNGCGTIRSVIGGSFCNVTANYNTSIGTYCENCTNYVVYQNSNPCFTGNQYYVNGTSYATNPSNGGCNYNANYSTPVGTYCQDCFEYTVYQNTNPCFTGNQFSVPNIGQTYATNPSNGNCNYTENWVNDGGTYCSGFNLLQNQIDNNPCTGPAFRTITVETNSTTCGYLPCSCYTITTNDLTITYTYGRCNSTQDVTATLNGGDFITVCSRYYPSVSNGGIISGGSQGCSSNLDCSS